MAPPDIGAGAGAAQVFALVEPAGLAPPIDARASGRVQRLAVLLLLAAATGLFVALVLPTALPPARRLALRWLAESLVRVDALPAHADAVAVHGGGPENGARELSAVGLWRAGRADRLVAMGGPLPAGDPDLTYARGVERRLRGNGVPSDAIVRMAEGSSTAGELIALRRLAEARGWHRVVLSSSRWHTRRIALLADQVFRGSPVAWSVVGTPELGFAADDWWDDRTARDIVLGEWAKLGFALLFPARP